VAGSGGKATADDIPPTPPPPLADFRRTHVLSTMLLPTSEEAGLIDMAEEEELEEDEETWVVPESAGETARDRPGRLRTATAAAVAEEDDASSIMVRSLSREEPTSSPSPRRRSVEEDRLLPASEQLGRDSSVSAAAVAVSVVVLDCGVGDPGRRRSPAGGLIMPMEIIFKH
jgi:hypothetical protein